MKETSVLLIDDDDSMRKGLSAYLRHKAGFAVTECKDGSQALGLLAKGKEKYNVVLLDLVLVPQMSGEEVLAEILEHYPRLPVIAITGKNRSAGIRARSQGACRYVPRPIDPAQLENMIREVTEQDMVFFQMARHVLQVLNADVCIAWRLDRRQRVLRVAAWEGELDEEYRRQVSIPIDAKATRALLKKGYPIYLHDVTDTARARHYQHPEEARARGWTALISIPLVRHKRIIGLIDGYKRGAFAFSPEERKHLLAVILPAFAQQAVETVLNAESFDRAQALHEINQMLAGTFSQGAVIRQILGKALQLTGAEMGGLYLVNRPAGKLILQDCVGVSRETAVQELPLEKGIAGWVVEKIESLNVSDVSRDERYYPLFGVAEGSEVAVPLLREGQTVGVLTVQSRQRNAFTDADESLLYALGTQVAIALGRAALTRHLQQVSELALKGDYQELANYVVDAVHEITGTDVTLWMMSEEKGEQGRLFRIQASHGTFSPGYARQGLPIEPGQSVIAKALHDGVPVIRRDIQDPHEKPPFYFLNEAQQQDWHGFMVVPLRGRKGAPLGALSLYSKETARFDEAETEPIRIFANQAAIAFEDIRALTTARARHRDLQQLVEIGQAVTRETAAGLKPVLEHVAKSAHELLGADYAAIYPYDPDKDAFDRDNVTLYPPPEHHTPAEKPRERGTAALVTRLGELVVHDVAAGHWEPVDFSRLADVMVDDAMLQEFLRGVTFIQQQGIQSFIGLSLQGSPSGKDKGQNVGVLYLDFCQPRHFTAEEIDLVRIFGHQAASAIQAARLFEREQRRLDLLDALQKTLGGVLAQHDPGKIGATIAEAASELLSHKVGQRLQAAIWLCDRETGTIRAEYAFHDKLKGVVLRFGESISGQVAERGIPLYENDYENWAGRSSQFEAGRPLHGLFRSVIAVPLFWEQRVIGVLALSSPERAVFDDDDLDLLERFAGPAAIALQNTRLYTALQKSAGSLLSATGEPGSPLNAIAASAYDLLGADLVSVYEYDQERGQGFVVSAHRGKQQGPSITIGRVLPLSVVGRAAELPEPHYAEHAETDKFLLGPWGKKTPAIDGAKPTPRFVFREKIKSSASVPLRVQGQVVGVMFVNYRQPKEFTETIRSEIELFANQAAVAIQNARSFRRIQEQREAQVAAIGQIGASIAAKEDLEHILKGILASAVGLLGQATLGEVRLLVPGTNELEAVVSEGEQIDEKYRRIPVGEGVTGTAARLKRTQWIPDTSKAGNYLPFVGGTHSEIAVPMLKGDEVIGVFNVEHPQIGAFSEQDVPLAEAFARLATVAVENARLVEQVQAKADRLQRLQVVTREISSAATGLDGLLKAVVENLGKVFSGSICGIRLYDADRDTLGPIVAGDAPQALVAHDPRPKGTSRYVLEQGEYYVNDTKTLPAKGQPRVRPEFVEEAGIRAVAYRRLEAEGAKLGVLYVNRTEPYRWTPDDKQLLELFANQAAIAIHNTQLYEQRKEHAARLRQLLEVTAKISSAKMDRHSRAKEIVDSIRRIWTDVSCDMLLYDPATQTFSDLASVGVHDVPSLRPRSDGISRYIIETGRPYYLEDATNPPADGRPAVRAEVQQKGVQAVAYHPLHYGEDILGILYLNFPEKRKFSAEEQDLLALLARQAAIALKNAQLFLQIESQRGDQIQAIKKIGAAIATGQNVAQTLGSILDSAISLLGEASRGEVRLLNKSGELEVVAARGKAIPAKFRCLPVSRGIVGWAVQSREPKRVDNVRKAHPYYVVALQDTGSEIAVPMFKGNEVIGVLNVEHPRENAFSEHDVDLATAMANLAVVAIENTRLFNELEEEEKQTKALYEIGKKIGAETDYRKVLDLVLYYAQEVVPFEIGMITLIDQDWLVLESARGNLPQGIGEKVRTKVGEGITGWVAQYGRSLLVNDVREPIPAVSGIPEPASYVLLTEETRSELCVPLISRGQVIGVINAESSRLAAFDEKDQRQLESFASQAAIAIENTRLFDSLAVACNQLTRQVKNLKAVNAMGTTLTSSISLSESQILDLIYQQATTTLGMDTSDMYIALYEPDPQQPDKINLKDSRKTRLQGTLRFGLYMVNGEKGEFAPRRAGEQPDGTADPTGGGLTEYVIRTKKAYLSPDTGKDYGEGKEKKATTYTRIPKSWMGVPLLYKREVLGVIVLRSDERADAFDQNDLEVLQAIAGLSAVALENARLVQRLERQVWQQAALRRFSEQLGQGPVAE